MELSDLGGLIERARSREAGAFDELVAHYAPRLYGYLYRLTGSRHAAEDLLGELLVRLVRTIGEYRHDGRFDAWLFRIATNLARDRLRRAKVAREVQAGAGTDEDDGDGLLGRTIDARETGPLKTLSTAEQIDRMQRAVGRLPEPEREVILLRHFSEMSFKEIAELMGTPLGTALARAHRGLARLRELMGEADEVHS